MTRNEQRYATPPGALFVYAPSVTTCAAGMSYEPVTMWKRPGLELRRLRVGERVALVGEHLHAQARHRPVVLQRELAVHVEVAREAGRDQVAGAVLDPLHRPAEQERRRGRDDVARVDGHLVAEPAADVGRDDLDVLLRQPGDEREHRAVRVRRLRGHVDRRLAGRRVDVGDAAAALERSRVAARVVRDEPDDLVRLGERLLGRVGSPASQW